MKTSRNILIAFLLNLFFSIFEFFGGLFTNSVSIMSDSIHDFADALSIGISYFLERISNKNVNDKYTYGYVRYSVLGAFITTTILIVGSILVIINSIKRLINPVTINYNGMVIFSIIGVLINFLAAYTTRKGDSINQKSVNLHMLEDVLGWIVVLIGSILMKFTNISYIDSLMSIGVSIFIFIHALKNYKEIIDLFLVKTPKNINVENLKQQLLKIEDIDDIHHIHVWSLDGNTNFITLHVVSNSKNTKKLKDNIRIKLEDFNIKHATIEIDDYECEYEKCL